MNTAFITRGLIQLLAIIAVPGIACFGYYSLDDVGEASTPFSTLIVLAYPMALIGLAWLMVTVFDTQRTRLRLWASALTFAVPTVLLLLIRSH